MKLIILECDGVIGHQSVAEIKNPDDWQSVDESVKAMGRLCQSAYTLVVVASQPNGDQGIEMLQAIYKRLGQSLEQYGGHIDALFFCPHDVKDSSECRKPETGLYAEIEKRFQCNLQDVPVISNTLENIEALKSTGAIPVIVNSADKKTTLTDIDPVLLKRVQIYNDLAEFSEAIIMGTDE
ncbi:MAG: HAD-IIIA family hydrolase [Gammaproteobacteria bacterium]|nr:HAD-IIIA family hydrolase [Gammaproteobacteria bacterium]MCW8909051.1 HAD-IIIA family hydrolase [Gammaproteobacteria bacterium]MCW9005580.1 HAD-IIIA family hydrolase [Gammaproteobacteria bacterium]MCW9056687.1 HAD-IIIA family hydrolase [Gammaproteobacteria bacterium]